MPIERDKHGEFYIECFLCEDVEELPDAENFNEAVEEAKSAGWSIRLNNADWVHLCPSCKGELP